MQVVAELRRKGRRVYRKLSFPPDDCSCLTARKEAAPKTGGRCFCDIASGVVGIGDHSIIDRANEGGVPLYM